MQAILTASFLFDVTDSGTTAFFPLLQEGFNVKAQVDSSIGGKVVVNYKGIKNVIGTFYQPHMVIIDPLILKTLDESQVINMK